MCQKIVFTFIFVLTSTSAFLAQAAISETTEHKRAAAFIEMLSSSTDEALRSFITGNMAPNPELTLEQRVERFRGIRTNLKDAKLVRVLRSTASRIEFVIKLPVGGDRLVRMEFELGGKGLIAGLGIDDAIDVAEPDSRRVSENELIPEVEKYLEKLSSDDRFSGAVLIAKNGHPIFSKAYGEADKSKKIANSISTRFNIGSENKVFTILAIGMLTDEGKLTLDDLLGRHLPAYPNQEAAKKVTIRHMLMMSSGIGDFFGPEFDQTPKSRFQTINDYLSMFADKPLEFEPGSSRRYSNGGFIVLGAIIEKVSGKSYYDFVRERIFKPLGMNDTDSYHSSDATSNIAIGYIGNVKDRRPNTDTRPARGSSAGGGYSTVGDMLKFVNAFESGKMAVPKSLRSGTDAALSRVFDGFGIAGGAPGINATLDSKLGGSYTLIVMSNYDPPSAESVARQIRTWLGGND